MAEYAPPAIRACYDTIVAAIPSAVLSGIVGDPAHTYGYHRGRNYVSSSDYSAQRPDDKQGNGDAACGLDVSLPSSEMKRVTQRLIDATFATDPRIQVLREFFGTVNGTSVTGLDVRDKRWVTSDPSHLWHVHLSVYRKYADDRDAMQGVAAVFTGSAGGVTPPPTDWFDMATLDDLKSAVRSELNQGAGMGAQPAPGQSAWGKTNQNLYDRNGDIINMLNQVLAKLDALLARQP